jgi:hypothetical protein
MNRIGSRAQVMHGNAKITGGGLKKKDLKYNKQGKIVSKKMSAIAKKEKRLQKAGYTTKKGQFGAVKIMRGGDQTNYEYIVENMEKIWFEGQYKESLWYGNRQDYLKRDVIKALNIIKEINKTNRNPGNNEDINTGFYHLKFATSNDKRMENIISAINSYNIYESTTEQDEKEFKKFLERFS